MGNVRPVYDWLSEDTGDVATALRDRTTPCGVISYGGVGDRGRKFWTWGCRCGAYDDGLAPEWAKVGYRDHKTRCPLKMGLVWNGEKWLYPTESEEPKDGE